MSEFFFVRHGAAVISTAVKDEVKELGWNLAELITGYSFSPDITGREALEGRLTAEGKLQMQKTAKELFLCLRGKRVVVWHGERTRHVQSAAEIRKCFVEKGVEVEVRNTPLLNDADWLETIRLFAREGHPWKLWKERQAEVREAGLASPACIEKKAKQFIASAPVDVVNIAVNTDIVVTALFPEKREQIKNGSYYHYIQ